MLEAILQVGIQLNFYWDGSQASRKSLQIKLFKLDRNLVIEITVPNDKWKKKKKKSREYKRKLKIEGRFGFGLSCPRFAFNAF